VFGAQGWIWGSSFLFMAVLFVQPDGGPAPALAWEISGVFALVGSAFLSFELWRKRVRLHLVLERDLVAIYRRGHRVRTIPLKAVKEERGDFLLLLKIGVALGTIGIGLLTLGILSGRDHGNPLGELALLGLGTACLTSLGAALRAKFFRTCLRLPGQGAWSAGKAVLVDPSRWKALVMGIPG